MSDHEFERQVQQKMDELKFSPSADVWKGVEQQLDKDRDRRRGLIWWPTLFLLIAGGGFLFMNRESSRPIQQVAIKQPTSANLSKPGASIPYSGSDQASNLPAEPAKPTEPILAYDKEQEIRARIEKQSASVQRISHRKLDYNNSSSSINKGSDTDDSVFDPVNDPTRTTKKASLMAGVTNSESESATPDLPQSVQKNEAKSPQATTPSAVAAGKQPEATSAVPETEIPKPAKKQKDKKTGWSFGITGGTGMSGMNDGGIANFKQATVLDLSGGISNSAFLPSNTVIYKPSVIKPGIGFSVGAYAERSLGKRWSAQAALNFTRFNQSIMVGRKMYTAVLVNAGRAGVTSANPYYTREAENKYAVHYDFLDLPLSLNYHVNPSSKVPVRVMGGLIGSRLLGSNALHFDGSSAGYFKNNELLNKWQLGVNAGLAITFMSKSSHPLTIGPSFRYQVTNTLAKDFGAKRNILSVGIQANVSLKQTGRK